MAIKVNKVTNANIYVNGNNFIGRAEEIDLPQIKMKLAEQKALGMIGSVEFFSGIDKMEAKIKWNSFYADALKALGDPTKMVNLMVRANLETYDSNGRANQAPLVVFLNVMAKDFPLGNFKQHENAELETNMSVYRAKMEISGAPIFEFDALANIYKIAGNDIMAIYKLNTGAV